MATGFKAVSPERAVQIMRTWAFHSWPMSVQDGIDVYTSFGFSPHPEEREVFTSDMSPDEADSFFTSEGDQIDSVRTHLSNVVPKEERPAFRSQVRAAYAGFVAAFTGVLGRPRSVKDGGGRFSSQWFLDNGVGVWVGAMTGSSRSPSSPRRWRASTRTTCAAGSRTTAPPTTHY